MTRRILGALFQLVGVPASIIGILAATTYNIPDSLKVLSLTVAGIGFLLAYAGITFWDNRMLNDNHNTAS